MKRTIFSFLTIFLLVTSGFGAPSALAVLSASPKGEQGEMNRQAVTIHFNQPVAKLGEKSQFAGNNCPLSIAPTVEGTCRFSGTQTLLFEPKNPWPQATRFTVTVPAGFKSEVSNKKLVKNYQFSFQTQTPQVRRVLPYNNEHWLTLTPTFYVSFSMPVSFEKMGNFVKLTSQKGSVPLAVRALTAEEHQKNFSYEPIEHLVALSPLAKLQKGTKYTLTFGAGLPAQSGNMGMTQDFVTSFYTYPALTVQGQTSEGCLPYNAAIQLSSPVRLAELASHTQTVPATAKKEVAEVNKNQLGQEVTNSKTGDAYFNLPLSFIEVKPHEDIQVTLTKGMQDIFGNQLAHDYTFTLKNNGYCPAVEFAGGKGVLESYLKPYLPIELINITSLPLRGARFNKDNFIPFDQQESRYCKEKPLAEEIFSGNYTFNTPKDRSIRTFIDLLTFKPTAKDSIIFSQVQLGNDEEPCWVSSTDNITDLGLTFKTSPETILVWVTSLQTGKPLAGKNVQLRDKTNRILWEGQTDLSGLARAPGWEKLGIEVPQWGRPELYVFAQSENGDGVLNNLWDDGLELWRFNIDYSYSPQREALKSYLFTDRGIYRPGETVYLKGIVRTPQNGRWALPAPSVRGKLTVSDGRGEEIASKEITLSEGWGTFDWSFSIAKNAHTGNWWVSFVPSVNGKPNEQGEKSVSFQVEDLKPAEFNVTLRALKTDYLPNEEAVFVTSASYQFGAPMAHAKAKWTLRQMPFTPTIKGYDKYTFIPYFVRDNSEEENKLLLSSSGELDGKGTLSFRARTPQVPYPVQLFTEVDVQSAAKQDLFARTAITVHPADFYVGTQTKTEDPKAGKPLTVRVIAVTPEGVPTEAKATAEIYREQWFNIRKTGLSGRLEWVSEKQRIDYPSQTVTIPKKGTDLTFIPDEGGWYYIKLTAKDLFGRTVTGGTDIYVSGKGYASWKNNEDDLIKIIPNKNEYKVGQTARLVVQNPYENSTALVSVEREGVLDVWTVELKNGQDTLRIPIKDNYLPNVFVNVMLVEGRTAKPATDKLDLGKPQAKAGYVNLTVVPDRKQLETTLKTNAKTYRPQDPVTVNISTRQDGKPVAAEVTVMVVDEGILALTKYTTPDLFSYFYGPRPLSVFTTDNRFFVIGQRSFGEKGENRGGGGSALNSLGGTDLRSDFRFTPYFAAQVKTDEKGKAQVSFKLPDNLTAFRVMAVSLTTDSFGKAETKIQVSKPIMITANLPRFAREGDSFACGAIVHNYEDKVGELTVSAQAQGGIELTGEPDQTVFVPLGQTQAVYWPCKATQRGSASVSFTVQGKKEHDGVSQELNVVGIEKPQTLAVLGKTTSTQEEWLDKPALLNIRADNQVQAVLSSTMLASLQSTVNYLTMYPFDCLEQQFSKILPALLPLESVQLPSTAKQTVQTVLDSLPDYQTPQGGFSYWKGLWADPYLTAYVLDVAQLAKEQDFKVPEKTLQKAAAWLENAFSKDTQTAYAYDSLQQDTTRAYTAEVLTRYGKNMQGLYNTLYARRNGLPAVAISYLLKTSVVLKRPQAEQQALVERLQNAVVYNPTTAYVEVKEPQSYLHLDDISATALALEAFITVGNGQAENELFVSWLVKQANAQGFFSNTHVSAQVLRALSTYAKHEQTVPAHFTAEVYDADQLLWTQELGKSTNTVSRVWPFETIYGTNEDARLKLVKNGTGTLFYTLSQTYEPKTYEKPINAGLQIARTVTGMDGSAVEQLKSGERYKVALTVSSPVARSFVAVEDFVPAGFEIVNSSLATEAQTIPSEPTVFNSREIYDGRIAAFADFLPAGTHTFTYTVSALCSGTFSYPAAWASLMYEPEVFGRNTTSQITISQ